jgi:hypothetical protein
MYDVGWEGYMVGWGGVGVRWGQSQDHLRENLQGEGGGRSNYEGLSKPHSSNIAKTCSTTPSPPSKSQ